MNRKLLTLLSLAVASTTASYGALYTLSSGVSATASGIVDTQGRAFRSGTTPGSAFTGAAGGTSAGPGVVGFGIFSTDNLSALSSTQLVAAFTGFGSTVAFNVAGTTGNRSVYSSAQSQAVLNSPFAGKAVYLFAGNGTTYGNSTEFLITKAASLTFNASDDNVPTPNSYVITPDNSSVLFGKVVNDVKTSSSDISVTAGWQMEPVPEPSAALLGALGAMVLLRRRRI
jgi:hypothetical protein